MNLAQYGTLPAQSAEEVGAWRQSPPLALSWLADQARNDSEAVLNTGLRAKTPMTADALALAGTGGVADAARVWEALGRDGAVPASWVAWGHTPALVDLGLFWGTSQLQGEQGLVRGKNLLMQIWDTNLRAIPLKSRMMVAQLCLVTGDRANAERVAGHSSLPAVVRIPLLADLLNPYVTGALAASAPTDASAWEAMFGSIFTRADITPASARGDALHPFDRLTAPSAAQVDGPLVTVIVPSFRPDEGLLTSLNSMIAQSHANQEIIVVDDASGPQWREYYEAAEALDERIRVLRMPVNGGSYRGRNAALEQARGAFITTQDADDWSHPLRLERQVQALLAKPDAPAGRSAAIRALDDLTLTWLGYRPARMNASSLMVRRSAFERVGVFDTTRRGADSEFHHRLVTQMGPLADVSGPLAVTRLRGGSLSRADFTYQWANPDRIFYRTTFRRWHRALATAPSATPGWRANRKRAFPAPASFLEKGTDPQITHWELIYLVDGTARSAATDGSGRLQQPSRGDKVAFIHLDDGLHISAGPGDPEGVLLRWLERGLVHWLNPSQPVTAERVIVLSPGLLEAPTAAPLALEAQEVVVVSDARTQSRPVDLEAALLGAQERFGVRPTIGCFTQEEADSWAASGYATVLLGADDAPGGESA